MPFHYQVRNIRLYVYIYVCIYIYIHRIYYIYNIYNILYNMLECNPVWMDTHGLYLLCSCYLPRTSPVRSAWDQRMEEAQCKESGLELPGLQARIDVLLVAGHTLWLCQNSYWKWPSRNSEFSHEKWWFSIVMLVYQRVAGHSWPFRQGESSVLLAG